MDWREASNDQVDEALDRFAGLSSAGQARVCDLIAEVDVRQSWMADGARSLTEWVAARLRIRHSTAAQLVVVARRLVDLPVLREGFGTGELSLDQVDAISKVATPATEADLIEEALGMSAAAPGPGGPSASWRHRGRVQVGVGASSTDQTVESRRVRAQVPWWSPRSRRTGLRPGDRLPCRPNGP